MELIYIGKRMNGGKLVHAYIDNPPQEYFQKPAWLFPNRIGKFETIGVVLECEKTDTGVKGVKITDRRADAKYVTGWWTDQATAVGEDMVNKAVSKPGEGDLDKLIEAVKNNTGGMRERKRAVIYIISKLL